MFVRAHPDPLHALGAGDRDYFTFRLVHSERVGARVRATVPCSISGATSKNASRSAHWPLLLVSASNELLSHQLQTLRSLTTRHLPTVEREAQRRSPRNCSPAR